MREGNHHQILYSYSGYLSGIVEDFIPIQLKEFDIYDEDREEITLANRNL